ncbi:MAG: beta-xylosidase [Frankiales bacterium]|nr:beta-xylosidase [Frankiales bacterium]
MSLAIPDASLPWRDATLSAQLRAEDLLARLTLEEKVAQLYGVWVGVDDAGEEVAPHQHDLADAPLDWKALIREGLGQLTRPFGTAPVDAALGARALARTQREIVSASRHGIPALAHEECLAGFTTWGATIYPVPLAWGASFDPGLVERMASRIGASMRSVGVHQGLAPVLDVVRDYRWGRVEETIGEDPYLVGVIGTAYVRGLEGAGVVATLKHFVGYSGSRAGRNHAPVSAGPREVADVLLPPFEMAVRDGGARSIMHSYAEVDGVPPAANRALLTGLLRDSWDFEGTVVADYFGISFLELLQGLAAGPADAGALALAAGVDVELPTVRCYGEPLLTAVRSGAVGEELVDRAVKRVLLQKAQLGLLDPSWSPVPPALAGLDDAFETVERGSICLDPAEDRALAGELAEKSVILLRNESALPLVQDARIAVVGPRADDPLAMMGCYSFPSHVLTHHADVPLGLAVPTLVEALRAELPAAEVSYTVGCGVTSPDSSGFPAAIAAATDADVVVVAVGDRAGLFGRGTSGEGCDAPDLQLPGVQGELLDALLDTGKPIVIVLITGRPYALGRYASRAAAILQAFFPGEEGGPAIAGILSGRVSPSGRLPVGIPAEPSGQPGTYLTPTLGARTAVSNLDPTALYPFGFGLSATSFAWEDVTVDREELSTDGTVSLSLTLRNTGDRPGAEVVQVYLHDPVAQTTRPVVRLIGFARVPLEPGESRRVSFAVSADLTSFIGVEGTRIVEPGDIELRLSTSSADVRYVVPLRLTGPLRQVGFARTLTAVVS